LNAAHGESLSSAQEALFRSVADRDPPKARVRELVAIAGRGAGKDSIASAIAVAEDINFDPRGKLRPGELATVMCVACDRAQAGIVFGYIRGYFESVPSLKAMVVNFTSESIELSNRVIIEVHTNSFRAVRGRSLICVIFDEAAFFRDEHSSSPDTELHAAVSPGLARMPGSMLVIISSAHKRTGLLYKRFQDFYGKNSDEVLVVHGSTLTFNPSFDAKIVERALEEDPQRYGAEYLSRWRDDLSTFIDRLLLEAAVDKGVVVRPPSAGTKYVAGCDASGGRNDSFTWAMAHREKDGTVILDVAGERKSPFNPSEVVEEIVAAMKAYGCREITGDNYGASWVVEAFSKAGAKYIKSDRDRSAVYMDTLPLFTSGRARLLDNPRIISQFAALERRTFSTGRERIDPGPGHDDLSNSCAIAMSLAALQGQSAPISAEYVASLKHAILQQRYGPSPGFAGCHRSKA